MLLCIGIVGAINMHGFIGQPFLITTPVIEKTERNGRSAYYTMTVKPDTYQNLELRVDKEFWTQISLGQHVVLTVKKNVIGLSVVSDYAQF